MEKNKLAHLELECLIIIWTRYNRYFGSGQAHIWTPAKYRFKHL
jgi:hypothetical protein